ncbi:MAG: O-linked N-acetylglucosamine transferase, SPINDLY family protein [Panacagrimonas sp.]
MNAACTVPAQGAFMRRDTDAAALNNRGLALRKAGRVDEARKTFEQALKLQPGYAKAHYNLGLVEADTGAWERALICFDAALQNEPGYVRALVARAGVLSQLGRNDEAQRDYTTALAYEPGHEQALHRQALLLGQAGRHEESEALLRRLLGLRPESAETLFSLGSCLMAQKRLEDALHTLRRALSAGHAPALASVVKLQAELCDWTDWAENLRRLCEPTNEGSHPGITPSMATHLPVTTSQQFEISSRHALELRARMQALTEKLHFVHESRAAGRRLRIGYLSCDFRNHATAHLMRGLFALHDRSRLEIFAYSYGPDDGSEYRRSIERDCDRFVDIQKSNPEQAARRIHADGIDILLDLVGFAGNGRPEILALRPAPVQVNYLGFPATMGAGLADFILADAVIVPPADDPLYGERVIRLPHSYQCTDREQAIADPAPPRSAEDLPASGLVFCCFNAHYKFEPQIFALWMRVLSRVPDSVLWLLQPDRAARLAVGRLRAAAAQHGVDPARLRFAPLRPKPLHLARSRYADLFLDTPMCNAHTTATDALWAGVPVLTCTGQTFATRVCASLLTAVGMPELIAGSPAAYEEMSVELALNPDRLCSVKSKLERKRLTTALFDNPRYVRHLEAAFESMRPCPRWQEPSAPDSAP